MTITMTPCSQKTEKLNSGLDVTQTSQPATHVKTIIIGAGPVGLFTARLLEGLSFIHDLPHCVQSEFHTGIKDRQNISRQDLPVYFDDRRGKTAAGQWFDSFLYQTDNTPAKCLLPVGDKERKVDWLLLSEDPPGGGWTTYHQTQLTISPYNWTGLPDYPIEASSSIKHYRNITQQREKTDAQSLCTYFTDYADRLPKEKIRTGHKVIDARRKDQRWLLTISSPTDTYQVSCTYLVLATGKGKKKKLGIPGEQLPQVTHTTNAGRIAMAHLPALSHILIIGTGLSAADTITHAWSKNHTVTHIVPGKLLDQKEAYDSSSSSRILMGLRHTPQEYPEHCKLIRTMLNPANHKQYKQLVDYTLTVINDDGYCSLKNTKTGHITNEQFDLIAISAGSTPDFSFIQELSDFTMKQLNHNTMEVIEHPNLFIAGTCSGDWFQRFVIGHAFSIAETIKQREYGKPVSQDNSATPAKSSF